MIDSRLLSYAAFAIISLMIYDAWVADYGPKAVKQTSTEQTQEISERPIAEDVPIAAPITATTEATTPNQASSTTLANTQPSTSGQTIKVLTDVLLLEIDLQGGSIALADLLKYPVAVDQTDEFVRLLSPQQDTFYMAQSGLLSSQQAAPNHYASYQASASEFTLAEGVDELRIPLIWTDASGITVTKTYTLKSGSYVIDVSHQVENASSGPWIGQQYRQLQRTFDNDSVSSFAYSYTGGVIYSESNKYEKISFDDMVEEPLKDRTIKGGWAAMIQHYFLTAWIPDENDTNRFYSRGVNSPLGYRYVLGLNSGELQVDPGTTGQFHSRLFVGPKAHDQITNVVKGLELTVDYGWLTILSEPLFWLLNKIHSYVGNWGWSIILITILIKLVFYKLTEASYRSMARMRKIQPKIVSLRERYADDKQRQGQAMMELYKKEKINPLGGCLPMLVQIPVFIALYWVLWESVELRQAPFILWLNDLSLKDPYFVLPVIMGVTMFVQQKLTPTPVVDPIQAKVFTYLPVIFTFFFAFFPAGLVLYWIVNNLLTITQQWIILKQVEK